MGRVPLCRLGAVDWDDTITSEGFSLSFTPTADGSLFNREDGELVISVSIDRDTGEVLFQQFKKLDHTDIDSVLNITLGVVAIDRDGDLGFASIEITSSDTSVDELAPIATDDHLSNLLPITGDIQVNTETNSSQRYSSVAALADGGFVVTWSSFGQDGSGWGIYAQRYDSAGAAVGSEFQVNTFTNSNQYYSSIAALEDGGFVVTWSSLDQDDSSSGIYAQRYDSTGVVVGSEFQINTFTTNSQSNSSVAALADGGFVVTWSSSEQDSSFSGIYAQRYDSSGIAVGSEFQINTFTNNDQTWSSVAALEDGGFVVTWTDFGGQDGSGFGIYAQRYDSSGGAVGSEFQINTFTTSTQSFSSVAALADGGFVVTWSSNVQDGSGQGIYAQRYDNAGAAVGSEFQVNTFTNNQQNYSSVAALEDGGFVVTWSSVGQDGSGYGIYAQRYDADGLAVGEETRLNEITAGEQIVQTYRTGEPTAVLADGTLVSTWSGRGVEEVFVRLFELPELTEDQVVIIEIASLLANDTDANSDDLTITDVDATSANGASITLNNDGTISYDPTGSATIQALGDGDTLEDSFTYTISDGNGGTDTATVTLTVAGVDESVSSSSIAGIGPRALSSQYDISAEGAATVEADDSGYQLPSVNFMQVAPLVIAPLSSPMDSAPGSGHMQDMFYQEADMGGGLIDSFIFDAKEDGFLLS